MILGIVVSIVGVIFTIIAAIDQIRSRKLNKKWDTAVDEPGLSPHRFFWGSKSNRYLTRLRRVIMNHLYYSKDRYNAGTFESVNIQFYVDLMEAVLIQNELKILAKNMADFIRKTIRYDYKIITTPKLGNPILASKVAQILNKPLLLAKPRGTRKSYIFDGKFSKGDLAILIDDVSSDGRFLADPIEIIRANGIQLKDCIVIVHRKEGSAIERLRNMAVNLHRICELDDGDIAGLLGAHIDGDLDD